MFLFPLLLAPLLLAAPPVISTPVMPSAPSQSSSEDFLREYAETRRYLAGRPTSPKISPDGKHIFFLRSGPRSAVQTLHVFDVETRMARELVTAEQLLAGADETLSAEEKARLERQRISARGFTHYALSPDGNRLMLTLSGRLFGYELASGKVTALRAGPGPLDPQFSPDGRKIAYVREGDLYWLDWAKNREKRLTRKSSEWVSHGLAEFVAQEEMGRFRGFWWSPDSNALAYEEADVRELERFSIVDPMHPEKPKDTVPYPRAGKANVRVRLGVLSLAGGETTWVSWNVARYPYLATVVWPKKGGPLTLVVQDRAQQEEQVLSVNPATGRTRELLVETDAAWLNLEQAFPKWIDEQTGFLWFTERRGQPEVELRAPDGALKEIWIPGAANFWSLVGLVKDTHTLYFTGGAHPTTALLYRVTPGEAPTLCPGVEQRGWQEAVLSEDGALVVVQQTQVGKMPEWSIYRSNGEKLGVLPSVAVEPKVLPNVELTQVDVTGGLHAALVRPRDFQKGQKYPVLLSVYGGPNVQVVKDVDREHLLSQYYADQGFIVVKVDGRGTPRRGRAFERAIRGDFAGPALEDQVAGLLALGKRYPELDLERVGIEGWSFGGYMAALGVLERPDVFRAAVSGAPVTDWLDYDTHYTERYLGHPETSKAAYAQSSLLSRAERLSRPLLLIHGTADDNVYFFHTLKLSDALFRAGRAHELLPLSGFTHMVPDPTVTLRLYSKVAAFFRTHLGAPVPQGSPVGAPLQR